MQRTSAENDDRSARITEAMELYLEELEAGGFPDREAFREQFPEIADELDAHLEGIELVHHGAAQLADDQRGQTASSGDGLRTLGDFRLLRVIGRGGMGVVYEAEQQSLQRSVAVKVLPLAAMLSEPQRQRFRNEARAAATLDHANIVPVHFVGQERGVQYYVMQLIEGQSLAEVIADLQSAKENPEKGREVQGNKGSHANSRSSTMVAISTGRGESSRAEFFRTVARLGMQAAAALDHAHQQGILHRDIKPANLLIDSGGNLWVTDFGLARIENEEGLTQTGDVAGTLRYMAPERLDRPGIVEDQRADVYSLGVTLYELLGLRPAFEGSNREILARRIAREDPPPLREINQEVPFELAVIVGKAIARSRDERYRTAAELAEDLRRFLTHRPILARPPTALQSIRKWSRRHRVAVTTFVATGLTSLLIAAGLLWLGHLRTVAAYRDAVQQQRRAESHLDLAMRALDEVYLDSIDDRSFMPLDVDRFTSHKLSDRERLLLEKGLRFYEEFARRNQEHRAVQRATAAAYRRAGSIQSTLGNRKEAESDLLHACQLLEHAISANSDDAKLQVELAGSCLRLAFEYLVRGRADEAGRRYRQAVDAATNAIELDAELADAYLYRGAALLNWHQRDQALDDFERLLEMRPDSAVGHQYVGVIHRLDGRYTQALAHFDQATELDAENHKIYYDRGILHLDSRQYPAAVRDLSQAIELSRQPARVYTARGRAYAAMRQFPLAMADLDRALELDSTDSQTFEARGSLYVDMRQFASAVTDFSRAIRLDSQSALAYSGRGAARTRLGQYKEALADINQAIELEPDSEIHYRSRGVIHMELGDRRRALTDFDHAIERDPDSVMAHNGRASALVFLNRSPEALDAYERVLELDDRFTPAYQSRARHYVTLGRYRQAMDDLCRAVEIGPHDASVMDDLAKLLLNCPQTQLRDPRRAVDLAKRSTARMPQVPSYWMTLGIGLYRTDEWQESVHAFLKAADLGADTRQGQAAFYLAMAHSQLGNTDKAHELYEAASDGLDSSAAKDEELSQLRSEAQKLMAQGQPLGWE